MKSTEENVASYAQDPSLTRQQVLFPKALYAQITALAACAGDKRMRTGDVIDVVFKLAFELVGKSTILTALEERYESTRKKPVKPVDIEAAFAAMSNEERRAMLERLQEKTIDTIPKF